MLLIPLSLSLFLCGVSIWCGRGRRLWVKRSLINLYTVRNVLFLSFNPFQNIRLNSYLYLNRKLRSDIIWRHIFFKEIFAPFISHLSFCDCFKGMMKIKGSLYAAQKSTPDIFPKLSKLRSKGDYFMTG